MMMKQQIDIDTEVRSYAVQQERLRSTMDMIENSDMSEFEKDQFRIQAQAKFAGVGTGITGQMMGMSAVMNMQGKGDARIKKMQEWEAEADLEGLKGRDKENYIRSKAKAFGFTGIFESRETIIRERTKKATDRLNDINKQLRSQFVEDGKKVWTAKKPGERNRKIKEGDPQWDLYDTLKAQQAEALEDLKNAKEGGSPLPTQADWAVFQEDLNNSQNLQARLKIYQAQLGEEEGIRHLYDLWTKRLGPLAKQKEERESLDKAKDLLHGTIGNFARNALPI